MVEPSASSRQEVERAKQALREKKVNLSWRFYEHPRLVVGFSDALADKHINPDHLNEISHRLETLLAKGAAARSETEREAWKRKAQRVLSKAEQMVNKKPHKTAQFLLDAFAHPQALHQAEVKVAGTSVRTARRLEKIGQALSKTTGIEYYPLRSWRHNKVKERHASITSHDAGGALLKVEKGAAVTVTLPPGSRQFTLHHPGADGGGEVRPLYNKGAHQLVINGAHSVLLPVDSIVHIADNAFRINLVSSDERRVELTGEAGRAKGIKFNFTGVSEVPIGRTVKHGIRLMGR